MKGRWAASRCAKVASVDTTERLCNGPEFTNVKETSLDIQILNPGEFL